MAKLGLKSSVGAAEKPPQEAPSAESAAQTTNEATKVSNRALLQEAISGVETETLHQDFGIGNIRREGLPGENFGEKQLVEL